MKHLLKYMKTMCWAVAALALMASCDDDDKAAGGFAVDRTEFEFPNNGGTIELKISTDRPWTAETKSDWCMISPATGVGEGICTIQVDSSYLYKARTGRIILYSDKDDVVEVMVSQFGYEPVIEFTETELTVPSYASPEKAYVDIEAVSNVAFEVIIPEEAKKWLSYDNKENTPYTYTPSTTIPRKQKFRFKFATYTDFMEDRIAEIQFKQTVPAATRAEGAEAAMITSTVKITQEKAQMIIPSREGDSLAVLSVARVMKADGSIIASRPITHWNNVVVEERTYNYYNPVTHYEKKDTTELRVVGFSLSMMDTDESIPYQIQYLTELETFAAIGNANGYRKTIALGPEITELHKLKSLSLMGYGISSLPAKMVNMKSLEELDLNGNSILRLDDIKDVLLGLKDQLKYLDLGGNRMKDAIMDLSKEIPSGSTLETIGLGGDLSRYDWLFSEMSELEELHLSYNYFYGSIPSLDGRKEGVLPKMRMLTMNLNRLTGKLPDWVLYHPYLACWNPFTLLFNQEGYDNNGKMAGFSNAPTKFTEFPSKDNQTCPKEDEEAVNIALRLPPLTQAELDAVPLHGNWRYYKMLNKKWYLNCK